MSETGVFRATNLPDSPLDAAKAFFDELLPEIRALLADGSDIVIEFDHADHTHDSWRQAAIEELAREAAPQRVNAVSGPTGDAMDDAVIYLGTAKGVTGQILKLAK